MRRLATTAAFAATTFVLGAPLMAEEMTTSDVAKKYFLALYAGDNETVRDVASPNMAFQDPTAPDAYGVPVLNKLEPVIELFSGFAGQGLSVEFTNSYASNDQVVLAFELSGTLPAASLGMDSGNVAVETNGVTVLQVTHGQIVSHTDYMNYPRFEGSIEPVE